ncbi:MAG: NAD-dependent epimerase/dehydratase family protein, partial [Cyanobacteria bacterium J06559_3]
MKVAITGGTGFVGSHLVKRLHTEGHTPVIFTRDAAKAQRIFPSSAFPKVQVVAKGLMREAYRQRFEPSG